MCKDKNMTVGIRKLDFTKLRGRMIVSLTDGRDISLPISYFPEIKKLPLKERNDWMILDDQFFTFTSLSKIFSVVDVMKVS